MDRQRNWSQRRSFPRPVRTLLGWYPASVLVRAARGYTESGGTLYAAAMSYYALFALFPAMVFLVTVFGWLVRGDATVQAHVVDEILNQFPAGIPIRSQIATLVQNLSHQSNGLVGALGLLSALWVVSGSFAALRRALNIAFGVPGTRSLIHGRLIDLLAMFLVTLLVLLSTGVTALVGAIQARLLTGFGSGLTTVFLSVVSGLLALSISFVGFLLMYRLIPGRTPNWRELRIAALLAAIGFEVLKFGFGIYVANFNRLKEVYGTLSGVIAFLLFVFLVSNLVLLAAGIASVLAEDRAKVESFGG